MIKKAGVALARTAVNQAGTVTSLFNAVTSVAMATGSLDIGVRHCGHVLCFWNHGSAHGTGTGCRQLASTSGRNRCLGSGVKHI
jgi:hypothetical protein